MTQQPWLERARCRTGVSLDTFFPEDVDGLKQALRHCQRCRVQGECLMANLQDNGEGVIATTLSTRRALRALYVAGLVDEDWCLDFVRRRNRQLISGNSRAGLRDTHVGHDDAWVAELRDVADRHALAYGAVSALYGISVGEAEGLVKGELRPDAPGPLRGTRLAVAVG